MDTLIAISEIHYAKEPGQPGDKSKGLLPKRPVTAVIKAGTVFKAEDADQQKEMIDAGAARKYDGEEAVGVLALGDLNDARNAIVTAPDTAANKRAAESARRQTEAEAKGLAALQAEFEQLSGSKPHGTMKLETLQRRIEEMRAEKEKGGDIEGNPVISGSTDVAASSMADTSAPAAQQVGTDGTSPKSGDRTGADGMGDPNAGGGKPKKAGNADAGEDLV